MNLTAHASKPVYYVSDRPEAYELWAEVSLGEARDIASQIARKAAEQFPDVEFLVDGGWHSHQRGLEHVANVIEENWRVWVNRLDPN